MADQPDYPTSLAGARRRRISYPVATSAALAAAAVGAVAAVATITGGSVGTDAHAGTKTTSAVHISGGCRDEAALITTALDTHWLLADVDGDKTMDRIATAVDDGADPRCRAFVGVRTADGTTFSTVLAPPAVPPPGMKAELIGAPDLGGDGRAELVVDTHLMADGALAQLFTLTGRALQRVPVPAFEDGNFVVEGGGVMEPHGAACTTDGSLVLSMALLDGDTYQVTRHVYPVTGDPLRFDGPSTTTDKVASDRLAERFPEFSAPHFADCYGELP